MNEMPSTDAVSLTDAVRRVESIRDIKDLQRHYAHLSQFGHWSQMTGLFAEDAVVRWGTDRKSGSAAIEAWLREDVSAWRSPQRGSLHTEIIDQPLINLSRDGHAAVCRWHGMRFLGDGDGTARIEAGIYENHYRLTGGEWKISAIEFEPLYDGDYATGWTNAGAAGLPIVPRHFTPDEAGTPIGRVRSVTTFGPDDPAELAARIDRLNDEDDVRNLQHVLGYYVDRKMWTDAEELFDDDALVRVGGVDYANAEGVRQALRRMGPEGLDHGELNDRPLFDVVVDVQPGGQEALATGIEVGMLGETGNHRGLWEFSVFRNRFVKRGGIWRIQAATITRLLRAEYSEGWADGGIRDEEDPAPLAIQELVRRVRKRDAAESIEPREPAPDGLGDLVRRLTRSLAYDSVENVSAAYGYYLDDFQWPEMARLFAAKGHKQSPFAGYYLGPNRILEAAIASHGAPKAADAMRERAVFHWRPQSVIMVSHDGRSANLRTRLFQTRTATDVMPEWTGIHSGSYANDQAVLEDGVWRLWSITIDEYYFSSPSWSGGWASAQDRPADAPSLPASRLLDVCPPDIPLSQLGERARGFRGGPGRPLVWPEIVPMWFHYRNPVSGRVPDRYWPDCVPARFAAHTSMTQHGYQLPPTGPAIDGLDLP